MSVLALIYVIIAIATYTYVDKPTDDNSIKTITKKVLYSLSWPASAVMLYIGFLRKREQK